MSATALPATQAAPPRRKGIGLLPDVHQAWDNLRVRKLRSALTMLGMIFGVAAVVSMLSIGAGAQQQVMAFIEDLGVRNLIVEAKESTDWQAVRKTRQLSQGLSFSDLRVIKANIRGLSASSARKRFVPSKMVPKPTAAMPVVYGVERSYASLAGLRVREGRLFGEEEERGAAPVCVLGEGARASLFGERPALGEYVKVNEQWFRVIGVAGPLLAAPADLGGVPAENRNNVIYVPLGSAIMRLEDTYSRLRDEIDGIYLQLDPGADSVGAARVVRGILDEGHKGANDFGIVVPAELLAEQQRTQRIFDVVMVAIASISLLVGGIGIMNIMLASILERTREIGVRRAVGARQREIVRQFLVEAVMISCAGGFIGVLVGFAISRLIAYLAGWTTIVTPGSVLLALGVSISVGLLFGVYPARKAARLDPVTALHYE